jgi:capsid protein
MARAARPKLPQAPAMPANTGQPAATLPTFEPSPRRSAYDATETRGRRKAATETLATEDRELNAIRRRRLIGGARDIARNYSAAAWAIRKHLDYTATFKLQARTDDEGLNQAIEDYIEEWSKPENCDVAERHDLHRMIRLAEARRIIDGDCFLLKLREGRLQAIEAERIATPPGEIEYDTYTHGIRTDSAGRAAGYALCTRNPTGRGVGAMEREIAARFLIHHAAFDRFDQIRGISPLAAAYNTLRDTYEAFDFALAKLKVSQLFAMAFYRDAIDPVGSITPSAEDAETGDRYDVDFGRGPVKLELEPGDKAEFLESKTPSAEFQNYTATMIALALKALDIPFSFYDESFTTYSGARQALLMYEQSAEAKRRDVRAVLNNITRWQLYLATIDGRLALPRGMTAEAIKWEWVPAGLPWIDPLKEITADISAIQAGLDSTAAVCKRAGVDAYDLARQEAAYQAYRASLGLPAAGGPAPITLQDAPQQ